MRTAIVLLAALTAAGPTFAADLDADILLRACQGLKPRAERGDCLAEAAKAVLAQSQDSRAKAPVNAERLRAEGALESARTLQSIVGAGVSLTQYQPYVQQFAIALAKLHSAAKTQDEKDIAALLADSLQAYSDAGRYWQANIETQERNGGLEYAGSRPEATASISERYGIPIQGSGAPNPKNATQLSGALSTIWAYAKERNDAASGLIENAYSPSQEAQKKVITTELASPKPVEISRDFIGGSYARPDYSAERLGGSIAGIRVRAYASRGAWMRLTPKGVGEQWMPMSQLSVPD